MDQYIHFSSNHPWEHKKDLMKTLMHRVNTIVSDERDKVIEKSQVNWVLNMNDYPDEIGKSMSVILLVRPKDKILKEPVVGPVSMRFV